MKIDAVAVTSTNMQKSIAFYEALGFEFSADQESEDHIEAVRGQGSARLMIDSAEFVKKMLKIDPKPSNHSVFALLMESPGDVDRAFSKGVAAGGQIIKEPWDASWGQRYAIVADPDGYLIDLFAPTK